MNRSTFPGSLLVVVVFILILVEQFIDLFVVLQTGGKIGRVQGLVIIVLFLIVLFQFRLVTPVACVIFILVMGR